MPGKQAAHGGAWKVAYADFVTAMMALFLVLWIVAMSQEMKESIAGYFRSTALLKSAPSGVGMLAPITKISRTVPRNSTPPEPSTSGDMGGQTWAARVMMVQATLRETARQVVRQLVPNNEDLTDSEEYQLEFMNDGFRLNVLDRAGKPLFEEGTANLTEHGEWVFKTLAWELERYPFRVEIEGHTPAGGEVHDGILQNDWDLSTRRALAAQKVLIESRVPLERFWRVAGMADRHPLDPKNPRGEINRRVSCIMRLDPNADPKSMRRAFMIPVGSSEEESKMENK